MPLTRLYARAAVIVIAFVAVPVVAGPQAQGPSTAPATQPAEAPAPSAKGMGTLVGAVMTHDGQPASELPMRLVEEVPMGMGSGPRGQKITIKFTTDKDGKFEVTNIKPSLYKIIAGHREIGWVYRDVEIAAGNNEALELKLIKVSG